MGTGRFQGVVPTYAYDNFIDGNLSTIDTHGNSWNAWGAIDLLIHRDQVSKTNLNLNVTVKENENFLEDALIGVSSRRLAIATLGLSHSTRFAGGVWSFSADYTRGLDAFGAIENGDPLAGNAQGQFDVFSGTVSLYRPFNIGGMEVVYNGMVTGQWSEDVLFGSEQFSIGGYSSVRGTRTGVYFGNNGIFNRNELIFKLQPWGLVPGKAGAFLQKTIGELNPYVGFDVGRIFSNDALGIDAEELAGWTVGLRNAKGSMYFDVGYSDVAYSSSGVQDFSEPGLGYFKVGMSF